MQSYVASTCTIHTVNSITFRTGEMKNNIKFYEFSWIAFIIFSVVRSLLLTTFSSGFRRMWLFKNCLFHLSSLIIIVLIVLHSNECAGVHEGRIKNNNWRCVFVSVVCVCCVLCSRALVIVEFLNFWFWLRISRQIMPIRTHDARTIRLNYEWWWQAQCH